MGRKSDDLEPELTEIVQPPGRLPLGEDLTPRKPSARVAEDASQELGDVGPEERVDDLTPDLYPGYLERRRPRPEKPDEVQPTRRQRLVYEE